MKSELVSTKEPYHQDQLIPFLAEKHNELISSGNRKHIIGAGWLASPEGIDWDEEYAFSIFEKLGAFNAELDQETGNIYLLPEKESA